MDVIIWGTLPGGIKLADSLGGDAISAWSLQPQRVAAVAPLVRGSSPSIRDHGNTSYQLAFSNTRLHASPSAARRFCLEHARAIAALDQETERRLTVRYTQSGATVEFQFAQAVLTAYPAQQTGCTTIHTYQIIATALS